MDSCIVEPPVKDAVPFLDFTGPNCRENIAFQNDAATEYPFFEPHEPHRNREIQANSSRRRRKTPQLARTTASPSQSTKMVEMFRNAASEIDVCPHFQRYLAPKPSHNAAKIKQRQVLQTDNRRSRFNVNTSRGGGRSAHVLYNELSRLDDSPAREPLSSGYQCHTAPLDIGDTVKAHEEHSSTSEVLDENDKPSTATIRVWLSNVPDSPSPSPPNQQMKKGNGNYFSKARRLASPTRSLSDKENISPARPLPRIQPPVTHVETPALPYRCETKTPPLTRIPSRFKVPSTPRDLLSEPPRRFKTPRGVESHAIQDRQSPDPNTDDMSTCPSLSPRPSIQDQQPDFKIHIDESCSDSEREGHSLASINRAVSIDQTINPSSLSTALASLPTKTPVPRLQSGDCTIDPSNIPTALRQLSPAVSMRKRKSPKKETQGRSHAGGRVVLGVHERSLGLCTPTPFCKGAERRGFDFEIAGGGKVGIEEGVEE